MPTFWPLITPICKILQLESGLAVAWAVVIIEVLILLIINENVLQLRKRIIPVFFLQII